MLHRAPGPGIVERMIDFGDKAMKLPPRLLGAAFSIGLAAAPAFAQDGHLAPAFIVGVEIEEAAGEGARAYRAELLLPATRAEQNLLRMPTDDGGAYRVTIDVSPNGARACSTAFIICRERVDECPVIAAPRIDTEYGRAASMEMDAEGQRPRVAISMVPSAVRVAN